MSQDLTSKHIAVLMGGPGSERPISLKSGEGVVAALRSLGAKVTPVDVQGADFKLPTGIDVAFNVIHGTFGEDGQLQRILEDRGIPYTGERALQSELAIDKIAAKRRFSESGVATAAFEVIAAHGTPSLPLPFVVKAPREGSSVGVYVVKAPEQISPAIASASAFGPELLIEQYIQGRELTVGVIGETALPVIEIRPRKNGEFYDFANKYSFLSPQASGADHLCPAPLDFALTEKVQQLALQAHRVLGLEVYCRVDLLLDQEDNTFVLEVNTIPGMTPVSLLPEAARAAGISYEELCHRIIDLSLARHKRNT